MRIRSGFVSACAALALCGLAGLASAQTPGASPTPVPTPVPTPIAFSAHAHANATVLAQGTTYTAIVQLALAQRAGLTRVDVLSVTSDSFPVPPLRLTAVVNHRANTVTLWNDTSRQYRVQSILPRATTSPRPRPSSSPTAAPRGPVLRSSPFSKLEVLDVSLRMTGHTTTAGLATTGLAFDLQVRNKGDAATSHVTASAQVADEFVAFPVTLELSLEPGTAPFSAKLAYAVDDLTRSTPATTTFEIPAGYTEASSLLSIVFPQRSRATPRPSATPSPRPK
jgi:hypothetical protein